MPANEKERLKALKDYDILNSVSEDEFNRITELASLVCGTPISLGRWNRRVGFPL